jgi:hypothetical protein
MTAKEADESIIIGTYISKFRYGKQPCVMAVMKRIKIDIHRKMVIHTI